MKILVVGDGRSVIHERALNTAFSECGAESELFTWRQYIDPAVTLDGAPPSLALRTQDRLLAGPALRRLNRDLIERCERIGPDLVFVYRGSHIYPRTIVALKGRGCAVFGYNNDDPFGARHRWDWRHFLGSLPQYDHVFAYRPINVADYRAAGVSSVSVLRSCYIRELNHPIAGPPDPRFACDVIFVGHFEDDKRDIMLSYLLEAAVNVRIFGPEWHRSRIFDELRPIIGDRIPRGADYNAALHSAKIALVFLSKRNRDSYTRRCFEIPAVGTLMLAERTADLEELFVPDVEAAYFSSKDELLSQVRRYLGDPVLRIRVASAGRTRLLKDGHEVGDRARQIIATFEKLRGKLATQD